MRPGTRAAAGLLVVALVGPGCTSGANPPATSEDSRPVSFAGVTFGLPDGWQPVTDATDDPTEGRWVGPTSPEGTRPGISVEVGCAPGDDAAGALDRFLDGPQWRDHEVVGREPTAVPGADSAERFTATYVLPRAASSRDAEVTRHGTLAVAGAVAVLVLVEGATEELPEGVDDEVLDSVALDAATADRVAACASVGDRDADGPAGA